MSLLNKSKKMVYAFMIIAINIQVLIYQIIKKNYIVHYIN